MKLLFSDEPIVACSTGTQSNAAIAVLRISGFSDLSSFASFFSLDLSKIKPRFVYFTQIFDGEKKLDDICLTFFEGPKSYNGENILELSAHGNTLNVERILNLFLSRGGCRLASPGEFTYRALKNRKLDFSQVEGLDLFLNANSGYALDQGLSLLSGNLHDLFLELYDLFLKHKASLELSIDFSDDVGEEAARSHFFQTLNLFQNKFELLFKRVQPLSHDIIRPEIVLAGLPNSGKSSLFNFLLADDRAIVSPIAGTTRDYLTETISIEGVNYRLVDTAGLRESSDLIEEEGVKRTRLKINKSFFSILLVNPLEVSSELDSLLGLDFDFVLFTHSDCAGFDDARIKLVDTYPQLGSIGAINILTLNRSWEDNLYAKINNKYLLLTKNKPILLDRHKLMISKSKIALDSYVKSANCESDVGILSSELNNLGHCVSELLGIISPDQILNSIFDNFCIGK